MQVVFKQNQMLSFSTDTTEVFGRKIGLAGYLFGCWHENLSRPFGKGRKSYIVCLDCGARRHFDPNTFRTFGSFHFPPIASSSN